MRIPDWARYPRRDVSLAGMFTYFSCLSCRKLNVALGVNAVAAVSRQWPVSQAGRPCGLKLRPSVRGWEGRTQLANFDHLQTSNELTVFDSTPSPFSFFFTLTFHFNYGSLCFQASFWPLWQEGDAYVVTYSCRMVTSGLICARFLQAF